MNWIIAYLQKVVVIIQQQLLPVLRIVYIMWNWLRREKRELDLERTYIRVQFLTAQEKRLKRKAIQQLEKQYSNEEDQIVPYEGSFQVSYKFVLNTNTISGAKEPIKGKMILNELICHLEVTTNEKLAQFINTYIKEIQTYIHNEETILKFDVIPLYSEVQASDYRPEQVLEIIYEPKSLWERIKNRTKKIVKNVPGTMFSIIAKIVSLILGYFGFSGGVKGLMWKMLPTSSIIQWVISAIGLFFPMLAPLITVGSKFLI